MVIKREARGVDKSSFLLEVENWVEKTRAKNFRVRVQPMKRKWASCSTRRNVTFSTELLSQRRSFRSYVIVHELLHLKLPNHGKLFKSLLRAYLPKNPYALASLKRLHPLVNGDRD
jgi:predicted metal-dependent hydrolase